MKRARLFYNSAWRRIVRYGTGVDHFILTRNVTDDDVMQEFWYHCSRIDEPVKARPNPKLHDCAGTAQTGA
jgi:hypothetical protein